MISEPSSRSIPSTRVGFLNRYVAALETIGAPVDPLLDEARIRRELLSQPSAAVPLASAFKFGELACRSIGSEHLALHLGLGTSLEEYGPYGAMLKTALTVGEYLRKGIALYRLLITGQYFWLSRHGGEFRLNLTTVGDWGVGSYQSHLESIASSIANLRPSLGASWVPGEISFAYRSREKLTESDLFEGARVYRGNGMTYLTIPAEMMNMVFRSSSDAEEPATDSTWNRSIPERLDRMVQFQIESLLSGGGLHIDTVAESMLMSRRSLQRRLLETGWTFSRLVSETRSRLAARQLQHSDKPIADIALELGYADASNFTRAFRRKTGVAPLAFRMNASGSHVNHK